MTIDEIVSLLAQKYGSRSWRPRRDPVSELIFTILSQNTSDANSKRAFDRLLNRFKSWETVADAAVEEIAESIWVGGLARVKAPRIKNILKAIREKRGYLELDFLRDMPLAEAKAWLRELPGVGPKTAACVLLFSLGRPALPVDTHVYRVARRLGLIDSKTSVEEAHDLLEAKLLPAQIYEFHVYIVEHGRRTCTAQRPRCPQCVLRESCPSSVIYMPLWERVKGKM